MHYKGEEFARANSSPFSFSLMRYFTDGATPQAGISPIANIPALAASEQAPRRSRLV